MKTIFIAGICFSLTIVWSAFGQEATPSTTPRFVGGTITGDAANGGPVGNGPEAGNNSGFNSGEVSGGGSTATVETPIPKPSPKPTPKPTP